MCPCRAYYLPPAVLFGQHNKLTTNGPFLDLLRAFKDELSQSAILTVVGYSFRDEHINACIAQWLHSDEQRRLVLVNRSKLPNTSPLISHLRLYERDRLTEIIKTASEGLKDLYG